MGSEVYLLWTNFFVSSEVRVWIVWKVWTNILLPKKVEQTFIKLLNQLLINFRQIYS